MILLVHLKILRSTISKIPGFQDLAESTSSIQGQKIKELSQGQNSRVFPGFQDFQDYWPPRTIKEHGR